MYGGLPWQSPPSSLPSYSPRMPLASAASGGGGGANWLQPRYKDGKKRIRPQLISSNGPPSLASASGEGMSSPSAPKRPRPMGAPSSSSLVSSSVGPRPVVSVVLERESVRFTVECPYDKAGVLTRILSDFEGYGRSQRTLVHVGGWPPYAAVAPASGCLQAGRAW